MTFAFVIYTLPKALAPSWVLSLLQNDTEFTISSSNFVSDPVGPLNVMPIFGLRHFV